MNIKKTWLLGLIVLLGFAVISCGESTTETTNQTEQTTSQTETTNQTEQTTSQTETTNQTEQTTSQDTTSEVSETTTAVTSSDSEILQAAANKVIISNTDNLTTSFNLPAEVDGLTVTWVSNNTDVISVSPTVTATTEGYLQYAITVNQPNQIDGTATVTLTGTFYYGDATFDKVFTVRVPAVDDASIVTTIAAGMALDIGTYITWKNMTVIGFSDDPFWGPSGFFFTDGIDIMYVYNSTFLETITLGGVYDIKGGVELYYSIPEVKTIDANTVDVVASTGAVSTLTPTPATISQMIANHTGYDNTNPMQITMYTVTGTVYYDSALGADYSTYLIPAGTSTLDMSNAIRIYYKSNMAAVTALEGQTITIDLVLFGYKTADWYAYFLGEAADISTANMTDADKLAISEAQLETSYAITSSFELPTLVYGDYSNVIVSTEIASYLSYSGGAFTVTRPTEDTTGTLSLTITYNEETVNKTINITMKAVVVTVPGDDIFISQYVEGAVGYGYDKYIEIYNGTDASVDLSEYTLELYSNYNTTASATMTLSGTLDPGEVIVIANSAGTIYTTAELTNDSVINFNGNDAIVLKHNGVVVDSIGQIGDGTDYAKDVSLVRKSSVTGGDTDPTDAYDPTIEWDAYASDNIEDLGTHTQD